MLLKLMAVINDLQAQIYHQIILLWRLCPRELRKHVGLVMSDDLRWDCFFDYIWIAFGLH